MNYQIFKSIIESIIANFKCESCMSWVSENNIEIIWAAWGSLNVDVVCPSCSKHTVVRAEVANVNLWAVSWKQELKEKLVKTFSNIVKNDNNLKLNDKVITDLSKALKTENIKVQDFLN